MADPQADASEEKPDANAQMELFAERSAQALEKIEATAGHLATLTERAAQAPQPPPAPAAAPAKIERFTEEQVFAAIERKEITQAQGMALLLKQAREEAKEEARKEADQALAAQAQTAKAQTTLGKIAEYQKAIPGLRTRGSAEWNRVAAAFEALVEDGHDRRSVLTELAALREVFGRDPSAQTEVREVTRERVARQTETPSSSSSRSSGKSQSRSAKADGPDPEVPDHVNAYIDHMVNLGQFKGRSDPKAQAYLKRYKDRRTVAA